jgi:hypothetical protein
MAMALVYTDYIQEMNMEVLSKYDMMTVAEEDILSY